MEAPIDNTVIDYATQRFGTAPAITTETTEIVESPVATTEPTTDAAVIATTTEPVETTTITTTEPVAPDYNKFLNDESEGLFGDVDSFKQALPKIKGYDTLAQEKAELEEKLKVDPFANDYVKTLNEMVKGNKSADEIEAFTKISRLDVDNMSAVDAKVMKMVKDGYGEAIARQIVTNDFPIEDYEEGSTERMILEEKLRVSSLDDRKALKEWKKDLTTVDNTAQTEAEQNRLNGIAAAEAHKKAVVAALPKIAESIKGLGERNLNGKEGDEAVKLNFDYNAEFKAELPQKLASFFLDGKMEVSEENIEFAQKYLRADYLEKNFDQLSQSIFKHAEALTTERMVNKYENRTGLPVESTNVVTDNTQKEKNDFLMKIATGR